MTSEKNQTVHVFILVSPLFSPVEALAVGPCYKPTNITFKESASILKTNISTLLIEINSICFKGWHILGEKNKIVHTKSVFTKESIFLLILTTMFSREWAIFSTSEKKVTYIQLNRCSCVGCKLDACRLRLSFVMLIGFVVSTEVHKNEKYITHDLSTILQN